MYVCADAYEFDVVLPTELLGEERLWLLRDGRPESEGRLDSDGRLCGRVCALSGVFMRVLVSERAVVTGIEK